MAAANSTKKTAKADAKPERVRRAYMPAAERRKQIIAAAQEVFARDNLKGARTRDIAQAAQVNQATIFEHFKSKEALFQEAVIQPLIDSMSGARDRAKHYQSADTPDQIASMAVTSAERNLSEMIDIFPLLTAALFSEPELGRELYREHVSKLASEQGTVLEDLARDGLDLDIVGLANFGIAFAIALDAHFGDKPRDIKHLAQQFARMSTGGFARDKTAEAIRENLDDTKTR